MINFLLIGLCLCAGLLLSKKVPAGSHKSINTWIIYLALPAVSFRYLPSIHWNASLLLPAIAPVIVWLAAWVYVSIYSRMFKLDKSTSGAMKLASGLSNTSFVGFPLIIAYFGEPALGYGVICDQVTFTLLCTAGVVVAIRASAKHALSFSLLAKRLLAFPPFIATVLALVLPHFISLDPLLPLFDRLASTVAPLALFSIGLQLKFSGWGAYKRELAAAIGYKLLIAPALVLAIVVLINGKGTAAHISIFEAAMPTFVSSAIIAEEYGLNTRLLNLVIGFGIILSMFTTAVWYAIITAQRP